MQRGPHKLGSCHSMSSEGYAEPSNSASSGARDRCCVLGLVLRSRLLCFFLGVCCWAMTIEQQIGAAAVRAGVSPALAVAVAQRESGLNPSAIGESGEVGLFQLMPSTAADLGVNPWDTTQNIAGGVRYLREMFDRFGSWATALVGYNAGPGAVERGEAPRSSYEYADDVLAAAGVQGAAPAAVFRTTVWGRTPATPEWLVGVLPGPERLWLYAALVVAGVSLAWKMAEPT